MADRRSARLAAFGAGAAALVAYLLTMPPSFGMWDTAELQTVAAILGIAHPPGCPAFTLLGWTFAHALPLGDPAWRVTFMCALAVAVSVSLAVAAALDLGARPLAAAVCALGFGLSLLVWRDATRAEVLDVALVMRALAFVLALRAWRTGLPAYAIGATFCAGLACATHGTALFIVPSVVLLIALRAPLRNVRTAGLALLAFAAGLLPYAYLPLRSAFIDAQHLDPMLALGLPPGLPFWNYGDPSRVASFARFVTGSDFHVAGGFAGYLAPWRAFEYALALCTRIASAYGYAGTMLALLGIATLLATRPPAGIALGVAGVLLVPYAVAYPDLQDRDRYYSFALWCAAVAMAAGFDRLADLFELRPRTVGRVMAALALGLSFASVGPERANLPGQRDDRTGPDYVAQVRHFTPDDAIVLADWSYATPLAYAGYVQGSLGHRSVVPASPSQYLADAARWQRRRPVFFVGFDDALHLPGWHVRRVWSGVYSAYRLTK